MKGEGKRVVKRIITDVDKCIGCRACEVACSGFHAEPRYSTFNPARSRIQVVIDLLRDVYVPVRAGDYTRAECSGRLTYTTNGKEYGECSFCRASCPSRDYFKEPDSGLPLKCDMCEDVDSPVKEPLCVQVCRVGALTYEEREEQVEERTKPGALEMGLKSLLDKYGTEKIVGVVARMSKRANT